ncbi:hypothetical protein [Halopiger djelfimassiliensis]|uniref:hypothetical protein n=1 Tax=Halopiger djelfimassiliensis TaxID=1293047 RepID=UPI0006782800|nr:hypothetical protein [Halopiger djelfimassiliensis]
MGTAQAVLDRYADDTPYETLSKRFLESDRWTGDDPVLLLAEAAAATTGQRFGGIRSTVERFHDAFVSTGRVDSLASLAALDFEDDALVAAFGARRKRRVLLEAASILASRPEAADRTALRAWAAEADHYRYAEDPIGAISGVGPATFQYLRQLAGVDAVKPDPQVRRLITAIDAALGPSPLDTSTPLRTIASCEWLSLTTAYRPLEIDRIAWWTFTDADEREAVVATHRDRSLADGTGGGRED